MSTYLVLNSSILLVVLDSSKIIFHRICKKIYLQNVQKVPARSRRLYGNRSCCVIGCFNSGPKLKRWSEEDCLIHKRIHACCPCSPPYKLIPFPTLAKDPEKRDAWIRCVNRIMECGGKWSPTTNSRICSEHFEDGHDYPVENMGHKNIPSQYLPAKRKMPTPRNPPPVVVKMPKVGDVTLDGGQQSDDMILADELMPLDPKQKQCCLDDHDYDCDWDDIPDTCDGCARRSSKIKMLKDQIKELKSKNQKLTVKLNQKKKHKLQVTDNLFNDKGKMLLYTGMDKTTFDDVYKCIAPQARKMTYWKGPARTVNPLNRAQKPGPQRKLTPKNEFLLSMMKIKTGLHMEILGDLFGLSKSQVSRTCFTWWRFLAREIGSLVYNPEKHAIMKCRPKAFDHPLYRDVRHIVDCTEIFIETPKSLDLQASCWSNYKHHHTIKYLLSINPNGFINFVSAGWVGRSSDNHVTEHCGFLDILEPYDKVMGDRGFQIQKMLAQRFVTLVIPPGRKGEYQMLDSDVAKTQEVANRRIYVEQAIRRVKTFGMLQREVPITLIHSIDDVMTIAAGACNLRVPLSK